MPDLAALPGRAKVPAIFPSRGTKLNVLALIVAAGSGTRFGGSTPKQYVELDGEPLLRRTVRAFVEHPDVDAVQLVIDPSHQALYAAATEGLDLLLPALGAGDRQGSVLAGLEQAAKHAPDLVLIHDGARPFASAALISRVIAALSDADAVVPALPVTDTLRRFDGPLAVGELDRSDLFRMQTPQGFCYRTILDAHRAARGQSLSDDAALIAAAGGTVRRVTGEPENIKVTTMSDLPALHARAVFLPATGIGFDVHRLVEGRPLFLCGIEVPYHLGLSGHSDADVALHALTDAILGTFGAGDIGTHFPPSDERWRDADSALFLAHALKLLAEAGGRLVHVDLTIIGERPKIGPHRPAMVARLAELLGLPPARIGLKATTTEGLGFTGRGEGLAAQATATALFEERA